ncbi:DUF1854 domain-containing protein [Vulcanisaeta thermophila]|uniref:DUF1854 domain-containing protein n=1 Tax=Vulcanisaeta thermophila TaxID=867917 RepID=UPI0008538646|nr:DUF1854 domain-containing protein [Vulcanisaeta thermophila]
MSIIRDFLRKLNIINESEVEVLDYNENDASLTIKINNTIYRKVTLRRPFPITNPNMVLIINEDGNVVATLRDVNKLNPKTREIIMKVLNSIYFMPKILKIYSMNTSGDEFTWDIETDRGRITIKTRGRSSIMRFGNRVVIVDVYDTIYEIPDINSLEPRSRRILQSLI